MALFYLLLYNTIDTKCILSLHNKRLLRHVSDSSSLAKLMSQCICLWFQSAALELRFEEEELPNRMYQTFSKTTK